jgi:hypothetical protein
MDESLCILEHNRGRELCAERASKSTALRRAAHAVGDGVNIAAPSGQSTTWIGDEPTTG